MTDKIILSAETIQFGEEIITKIDDTMAGVKSEEEHEALENIRKEIVDMLSPTVDRPMTDEEQRLEATDGRR